MSGKKPSNVGFAIVRGFRGQMLYLASVHAGNGFHWVTGKAGAMVIADADDALALSERASREYGAKTTVVDFSAAEHVIVAARAERISHDAICTCGYDPMRDRFEAHTAACPKQRKANIAPGTNWPYTS